MLLQDTTETYFEGAVKIAFQIVAAASLVKTRQSPIDDVYVIGSQMKPLAKLLSQSLGE